MPCRVGFLVLCFLLPLITSISIPIHEEKAQDSQWGPKIVPCENRQYPLTLNSYHINPYPPKINQNVVVDFELSLGKQVTGGNITISVLFEFQGQWIQLPGTPAMIDLCSLPNIPPCPIAPQNFQTNFSFVVPQVVPGGNYKGRVLVLPTDSVAVLGCVDWELAVSA
eukprot:TRINITY_DN1522_c0_g1_i2.p1 TRINITY_DN1522_c0_g1~~TRINITY_DN1522_c0_g1_i2.p1  ORF type:complete len:188 (-),score=38.68 TRINITY_DN1522_c0_g1_i2:210-710(-)